LRFLFGQGIINLYMQTRWGKQAGFTIVELLIVIVVIGILAAITIVAFNGVQAKARDAQRKQNLNDLAQVISIYQMDNGNYITTGGGAGNGQGWVNGGSPTIPKVLSDAGLLPNATAIRDPGCLAGGVTGCSGYLKINCNTSPAKSVLLARLESLPTGQPVPAALTGCDNTGYWSTYLMNYYVEVS
jgi:prepilin-type N-terminal cleavage/methylation domain-containing protein